MEAQLLLDADGLAVGAKVVKNTVRVGSVTIHFGKHNRLIDKIISLIEKAAQGYIEKQVVLLVGRFIVGVDTGFAHIAVTEREAPSLLMHLV